METLLCGRRDKRCASKPDLTILTWTEVPTGARRFCREINFHPLPESTDNSLPAQLLVGRKSGNVLLVVHKGGSGEIGQKEDIPRFPGNPLKEGHLRNRNLKLDKCNDGMPNEKCVWWGISEPMVMIKCRGERENPLRSALRDVVVAQMKFGTMDSSSSAGFLQSGPATA